VAPVWFPFGKEHCAQNHVCSGIVNDNSWKDLSHVMGTKVLSLRTILHTQPKTTIGPNVKQAVHCVINGFALHDRFKCNLERQENQSVIYLCNCIGGKKKSSLESTTKSSIKVIFKNHLALGPYFTPNLLWSLKYYYY
jgi:hypothetical protein